MAKKEPKQAVRIQQEAAPEPQALEPEQKVQEAPVRKEAPAKEEAPVQPLKISFDAWWAMTAKKLPLHHHKEIVKADFKARGLSVHEPMAAYNKALEQYGVKTK